MTEEKFWDMVDYIDKYGQSHHASKLIWRRN